MVFLGHRETSTFAGQILSAPNSLSRHLKAGTRVTPRTPTPHAPSGSIFPACAQLPVLSILENPSLQPLTAAPRGTAARASQSRLSQSTPPAPRRRLTLALRARRSARRPRPAHAGGWGGGARLRCPQAPAPPHSSLALLPPRGPGPLLCVSFGRGAEVTAAAAGGGREGLWGAEGRGVRHLGEEKGGNPKLQPRTHRQSASLEDAGMLLLYFGSQKPSERCFLCQKTSSGRNLMRE